jgi:hypothetical protein
MFVFVIFVLGLNYFCVLLFCFFFQNSIADQIRYLVAGTTLWSGLSYVFSNNAVKILSKEEIQKRIAQAAAKRK